MENPNAYFQATLQLIQVMGFEVEAVCPKIKFLRNDSLIFIGQFTSATKKPVNTSGITVTMKVGTETIAGEAYDHGQGKWVFRIASAVTAALPLGPQDVSFILTRVGTGEETFIRIHEAFQVLGIT